MWWFVRVVCVVVMCCGVVFVLICRVAVVMFVCFVMMGCGVVVLLVCLLLV